MGRGIRPAGTEKSKSIQIGDVGAKLSNATTQLSKIINAGLEMLMTDVPLFVALLRPDYFQAHSLCPLPTKQKA